MRKPVVAIVGLAVIGMVVLGLGPLGTTEARIPQNTTEREIDFFSQRLENNPADVVSATLLGVSLRQNRRETGNLDSLRRAERVLRSALESLPGYTPTQLALASVLIDLHRFEEGLVLAMAVFDSDPQPQAALAAGDALLAMGSYDEAKARYAQVGVIGDSPALDARLARLAELKGDLYRAIALMEAAQSEIEANDVTGEPAAWFATRLGDLYVSALDTDTAESKFAQALAALPGYAPALAGLGDVSIARSDLESAVTQFEAASEARVDPDWLFTLAYLHAALGNEAEAARLVTIAEATIDTFGDIHPRDFAIHYADTGRHELALYYARAALGQSRDVYAHDVMAWALYRSGRLDEALRHAEEANSVGTADGDLFYHHGAILLGLGHTELGAQKLREALKLGLDPWISDAAHLLLAGS